VAVTVYGVIGDGGVLGGLRHPTMHPMQPLLYGLGLCHVRTQVAMDEPLVSLPDELPHLTESVFGYVAVVSERTPVIYVACDGDEEAAAGWRGGRLELKPLCSPCILQRSLFRRREAGAIDAALGWLGVRRARGRDRLEAVGLAERQMWEPAI
jgi:hypothetical protein